VAVPIDTNRSPWHVTNAHRDGWRRMEPDRFPDAAMPGRIVPFVLDGEHLIVSAFKRAEDGNGEILRFWSAAAAPQIVRIRGGCPGAQLQQTDLLERNLPETAAATDELTLEVRPFEIVTIRIAPTARQTTGLVGQTEKCL
jgi:alpha-mannosidase